MHLPKKYDSLSIAEKRQVREEYVRLQNGLCMFCNRNLEISPVHDRNIDWSLFPGGRNFLKYPVHLQHCHQTGWTEGAVHAYCNAVMWQYYRR